MTLDKDHPIESADLDAHMATAVNSIRLLTVNTHKGFTALNRRFILPELREAVRSVSADVVFLQEVLGTHDKHAMRFHNWPSTPQYEFLADSIWTDFAYGRNAVYPDGDQHFYRAGSDAPLVTTIANTGEEADELTSVTSTVASSVTIDGEKSLAAQRVLRAVGEDAGSGDQENGEIRVTLEGLAEDVKPGTTVPVTFLFRRAGEITVQVPIGAPEEGREESEH